MEEDQSQIFSANSAEYNNATAIEIRLKTDHLLAQVEKQLRGYQQIAIQSPDTGEIEYKRQEFGEPLANDLGIQKLMTFLSTIISPAVVSGNFKEDYFHDYIEDFEQCFSMMLVKNRLRWNMKIEDCSSIYDSVLFLVIPFISRLIGDGERKSMSISTHTQETNTIQDKQGFNLFGGFKK